MTAFATRNSDMRPLCMSMAVMRKVEALQLEYFPPRSATCSAPEEFRGKIMALMADRGANEIGYYLPVTWIREIVASYPVYKG